MILNDKLTENRLSDSGSGRDLYEDTIPEIAFRN